MKNYFTQALVVCSLLMPITAAIAQPGGPPMRDIDMEGAKSLKIAIYTDVLKLTELEAQKFWPVFNEFEEKQESLRKEMAEIRNQIELNFDKLSDKELEAKIDQMMGLRQKEVALEQEYYKKYKEILPIKKVALLHKAEMMYKRALIEKMREQHERGTRR